jgi:hypothetical protein
VLLDIQLSTYTSLRLPLMWQRAPFPAVTEYKCTPGPTRWLSLAAARALSAQDSVGTNCKFAFLPSIY